LSGVDTDGNFTLLLETETSVTGKISLEFVYSNATDENPFFGTIDIDASGSTNIMEAEDANRRKLSASSAGFLAGQNCKDAKCYIKIRLANSAGSTSIKLRSENTLPDLNAILIADGLSQNGLYHARIIDMIPLTQSI
jgi:hypothetical protein